MDFAKNVIGSMLLIGAWVATNSQAQATPHQGFKPRWIHGSLVNVRAEPVATATVLTQLKVNTPVQATSAAVEGGFCELVLDDGQRGFTSCQLLGDRLLTMPEVGHRYLPDGRTLNPNYSPQRAFWMEPSLDRLVEAGRYFESKFLTAEEQSRENQSDGNQRNKPAPHRFAIPEFEAMKAVMRNGITAIFPEQEPARLNMLSKKLATWEELKAVTQGADPAKDSRYNELRNLHINWGQREPSILLIQQMELPKAGTSLFRNEKEIGKPMAKTEEISAKFSIPYQAVAITGLQWVPSGHTEPGYFFGAWDIGIIETRLTREVYKHTIYASGKIVSERTVVKGGEYPPDNADGSECNLGYSLGDASHKVWKGLTSSASWVRAPKQNSDARLFYLYTKEPLPYALAKVKSQRKEFNADGFVSATSRYFDIDSDGVMDVLMWEGIGRSKQDIHDPGTDLPHYRMMFININAQWYLLAVDEFLYGCGC